MVPSHDIDRQITDLESLIKRLQDEIIEMANDADKPIKEDLTELFTKAHYNLENSDDSQNADQNSTTTSKNSDSDQTNSHVFPVIIPNTSPLNADQHKNNSPDDFTTVNTPNASNLTATFPNTRKNFALLQDDVEDDIVTEKAEDVKPSTTNETFEDLRAEIMAKVISEATGLPLNDSEEDL
ncbi:jg26206 [Pararge aegeria aegeria]|uniref:Jg26206 protein n=1 Tax=Pararge aegeria aegeria TaxID=348720 RepID=A0A8S4SDH4_9NEOP|nr:jg26206 [Pararge aegeria aegeria]